MKKKDKNAWHHEVYILMKEAENNKGKIYIILNGNK